MHTTDWLAAGEDVRRVVAVSTWHESPFFSDRERTVLALTDAVTRLGEEGVTDELWAEATELGDELLANVIFAIATINVWNRLAVPTRMPPPPLALVNEDGRPAVRCRDRRMRDQVGPEQLGTLRALAVNVAYRMVGSRTEAEDLAQEAMVRVAPALDGGDIRSPEAFTTTVTTRLAIDHLRLARVRREAYVGPWLPEPVADDALGPAAAAELGDSLSLAFLVVLESLGPVERAAFLLREVFGFDYPQLADTLGRSEDACRQLVSRAKQRVASGPAPLRRRPDRAPSAARALRRRGAPRRRRRPPGGAGRRRGARERRW